MTEADLSKLWDSRSRWRSQCGGGKQNLETSDMYARSTVQHELMWMADDGRIQQISRGMPMGGEVRLYYRG